MDATTPSEGTMSRRDREGEVQETALRNLVAGLPEGERERTLRRLLDELERLHVEHGVDVPYWIDHLREKYRKR